MPRGGFRPGAGRKKTAVSTVQAEKTPPERVAKADSLAGVPVSTPEPVTVLIAVMNGDASTPDGRPITPARISAAKELLPFFTAKLATTNEKRGADFDARTVSDDDLAAVIATTVEVINRFGRTGSEAGLGSGEGTASEAPGEV